MFAFERWWVLIMFVVIYGGGIVLAVWLVLWAIRVAPRAVRPDSALQILDKRFARGEIDQQEYESARRS